MAGVKEAAYLMPMTGAVVDAHAMNVSVICQGIPKLSPNST